MYGPGFDIDIFAIQRQAAGIFTPFKRGFAVFNFQRRAENTHIGHFRLGHGGGDAPVFHTAGQRAGEVLRAWH